MGSKRPNSRYYDYDDDDEESKLLRTIPPGISARQVTFQNEIYMMCGIGNIVTNFNSTESQQSRTVIKNRKL